MIFVILVAAVRLADYFSTISFNFMFIGFQRFLILGLLAFTGVQHSGYGQEKAQTPKSSGKASVVAVQARFDTALPNCNHPTLGGKAIGFPSQQRPGIFEPDQPASETHHGEAGQHSVEMLGMQTLGQTDSGILSKLWRTLVRYSRYPLSPWSSKQQSMECMGRGCRSQGHPSATTLQFDKTKICFSTKRQRKRSQRREKWEEQDVAGDGTQPFCTLPHSTLSDSVASSGNATYIHGTSFKPPKPYEWRIDQCIEACLSRWTSSRSTGFGGSYYRYHITSVDQRPPLGNDSAREGAKSLPRSASTRSLPQAGVVETPSGGHQAVGRAVGSVQKETNLLPGGQNESRTGSRISTETHPVAELSDCHKGCSYCSPGRDRRQEGGRCGCSRGGRTQEVPPDHPDGMRGGYCEDGFLIHRYFHI